MRGAPHLKVKHARSGGAGTNSGVLRECPVARNEISSLYTLFLWGLGPETRIRGSDASTPHSSWHPIRERQGATDETSRLRIAVRPNQMGSSFSERAMGAREYSDDGRGAQHGNGTSKHSTGARGWKEDSSHSSHQGIGLRACARIGPRMLLCPMEAPSTAFP